MPDTQLRFEAWTTPESGTFEKIRDIDVALHGSSGVRELSGWTNGRLLVPAWWEHTDELVTDSAGCLIAAYLGDTLVDEFKATRVTKPDKRPSQRALTGPQINGIVEGLAIFPYQWPNQVEGALDWIWGGENALPDLRLASLGNISATYELYLSGERYELDVSLATSGDYTLGYNGNNTSAIDWDATHSDIKTAVEALPGVTEVSVLQPDPDTREFFLVFENPKDLSPDLTANFGGLNVAGNLTKMNDGFDTGTDPTFTVDVDGDTTEALDWDISDNGLEGTATGGTGLQGLTTVSDVTVSGSGTAADPWIIAFIDPAAPSSVTVTFAAGSYSLTRTQAGALAPGRITQSKPVDEGTGPEEVHGSYDDPALEVDTDVTNTGSDYSIKVNVAGRYGGSQVVFDVTPGQTYQAKVPVRKTVTGLHTLVVHDTAQNPIAQTTPRDNLLAADGSFHDLSIVDVVIPPGVTQVMLREANTDPSAATWAPHYTDWQGAEFTEGQPPAAPTKIIRQLVEAAQDRGAFEFLDLDFTDTDDTAGTTLDAINFTAFFGAGANLAVILSNLHRSGYEWRVVRKATPVGSLTHDLQFWAPGGGPEDLTASGGGPSILAGSGTSGAEVVRRAAPFTALMAHGLGSLTKVDTNATTLAAQGRIERILDAEHLSSDDALQAFLDAQFAEEAVNRLAATASIRADAQAVPLVDYGEGSKVWWQFPGILDKEARRVRRIGWVHGSTASFTVQGSKILTEEAAIRQALDRLLNEFRRRRSSKAASSTSARRDSPVGAHIHLQRSTAQSIGSGGAAISWNTEYAFIGKQNFAWSVGTGVTIQEPGYYDVAIGAKWSAAHDSPRVWVTRTRAGTELTVWPPSTLETWTAPYRAQYFEGTAPAIPCLSGDTLKVYVDHGEGSAQNLAEATVGVYLVDRTDGEDALLPDPWVWYKADAVSGVADGGTVETWVDSSGNGNDATQVNSNQRPTWHEGVANGLPAVRFDGDNDQLDLPNGLMADAEAGEIFAVLKIDTNPPSGDWGGIWRFGTSSQDDEWVAVADGHGRLGWGSDTRYDVGVPSTSVTVPHILNVSSATDDWVCRVNAAVQHSESSNTVAFLADQNYKIGSSILAAWQFDGDFYEIIIYQRVLTSSERALVHAYLSAKWGVTI